MGADGRGVELHLMQSECPAPPPPAMSLGRGRVSCASQPVGPKENVRGREEEGAVAAVHALCARLRASDGRGGSRRLAVEEGSGRRDRG